MKKERIIVTISLAFVMFIIGGLSVYFVIDEDFGNVRSATSTLSQTINAGTLAVDIVDAGYTPVGSPAVTLSAEDFSFACGSSSGTLGTATEQIYVKNPDAADGGWSLTIAASVPTAFWDGAGDDYDFNDGDTAGCGDGADTDSLIGQMTIDASGGTLDVGACSECVITNVTKGSSSSFEEDSTDSITLLTGAIASDDIGDWTLEGVSITQTLPPELPAANDYSLGLTVTVAAL